MAVSNWWIDNLGRNTLSGIPCDPTNPAILSDRYIICFLRTIPKAYEDFFRILPTMTPEEQDRLNALLVCNPFSLTCRPDPKVYSDGFQRRQNTVGIQTVGKNGGTGYS